MHLFAFLLASALLVDFDAQGQAEFQAGRFRAAKNLFEQSARLPHDSVLSQSAAYANLAQAQLALGELTAAETALRKAITLAPHLGRLWNQLGQVLFLKRQFGESEAAQLKALALTARGDPQTAAVILSDLAILYDKTGTKGKAMGSLQRAFELLPPSHARARILANLGVFSWKYGRTSAAARYLEQALLEMQQFAGTNHPDVGKVLEDYSSVLSKSGQKQTARQMAARAQEIRSAAFPQNNDRRETVNWRDLIR